VLGVASCDVSSAEGSELGYVGWHGLMGYKSSASLFPLIFDLRCAVLRFVLSDPVYDLPKRPI